MRPQPVALHLAILPSCMTIHDSDFLRAAEEAKDLHGMVLGNLTWTEAREKLEPETIVVIPLGAEAMEHGPRRFCVLTAGVSTVEPLEAARELLAAEGVTLAFTDIVAAGQSACAQVEQQPEGTHADEIETSMMLTLADWTLDMRKATSDFPKGKGPLSPDPSAGERDSSSGIDGDATLATREKGEKVVEGVVRSILAEIERLRTSPLPAAQAH